MGSTPILGIPYPEPTDPVSQGAAAMQAIATALETKAFYALAYGVSSLSFSAATQASLAVTFPAGRFTTVPWVLMGISGVGFADLYAPRMASAPTTSGMTIVLNAATARTGPVSVNWLAFQGAK